MRALIAQSIEKLRGSYWFVPTLMALASIAGFFVTSWLDHTVDPEWLEKVSWLGASQPAGARSLLSTIAASMIGVAGVTFSVTIASVSFASANFGPRLLTNFLRDRGNQVTLGTFIATFIYCLLALRLVQDPDPTMSQAEAVYFVPQITLLGAVFFAFASLAVLIFFLHHVPESIRVSTVVATIGRNLEDKVSEAFRDRPTAAEQEQRVVVVPNAGGSAPSVDDPNSLEIGTLVCPRNGPALISDESGFVQHVDLGTLVSKARHRESRVWLSVRSGDFVYRGQQIGWLEDLGAKNQSEAEDFLAAFAFGRHRTQTQDFLFLVDELVEVAARALSPGVNDPITAMACLDWLGNALNEVLKYETPSPVLYDDEGTVRLVRSVIDFGEIVSRIFDQLRPYLAGDRNATLYSLDVLCRVAPAAQGKKERSAIRKATSRLAEAFASRHVLEQDRRDLAIALWKLRAALRGEVAHVEGEWRGAVAHPLRVVGDVEEKPAE